MGRLDLPDVYRDEDYTSLRGDAGNPGTRQVPAPPAKGGAGSSVSALPESGRSGARPLGISGPSVDSPLMPQEAGDLIDLRGTEESRSRCACHDVEMLWRKDARLRAGGYWYCREKRKATERRLYARSPAQRHERTWRDRLKKYGISPEKYDEMLAAQGGVCAICRCECKRGRLSVDHNHQTGLIRGLLCRGCNVGIGHFDDNPERLSAAASYLKARNG